MKDSVIKSVLIVATFMLFTSVCVALETKPAHPADTKAISGPQTTEKSAKAKHAKAAARVKIVDINSASKKELMTLPGIGDAEAAKIIAGRPYRVKAHLVTHDILPRGVYENLKSLVIARQKQDPADKPSKK